MVVAAGLTDVNFALSFWTALTFLILLVVLGKFAWGPILQMLETRERNIAEAIESAKRERAAAEAASAEMKAALEKARAEAAALADDDELLWRCLFETLRFKPINPGPFRECAEDYTIADGSPSAKRIPAGTRLLVSTQSAMFDERGVVQPKEFRPDRPSHESMVFGYGLHWCIGAFLARAQITQTFKPLLKKRGLRRAPGRDGDLQTIGLMPAHLSVQFDR